MKCSANEVMTLAAKAARGGGAPPEQATLFGHAVRVHLQMGHAAQDIAAALDALPAGPIMTLPPMFLRFAEEADGDTADIAQDLHAAGPLFQSYLFAQPYASEIRKATDNTLHARLYLTQPNPARPVARIDLPDDLARKMTDLAARILVPESEASRLSGAGAGLTDND